MIVLIGFGRYMIYSGSDVMEKTRRIETVPIRLGDFDSYIIDREVQNRGLKVKRSGGIGFCSFEIYISTGRRRKIPLLRIGYDINSDHDGRINYLDVDIIELTDDDIRRLSSRNVDVEKLRRDVGETLDIIDKHYSASQKSSE